MIGIKHDYTTRTQHPKNRYAQALGAKWDVTLRTLPSRARKTGGHLVKPCSF